MKLALVSQKAQKPLVLVSYKLYINDSKKTNIPKMEKVAFLIQPFQN